jgi:hypothetical protein
MARRTFNYIATVHSPYKFRMQPRDRVTQLRRYETAIETKKTSSTLTEALTKLIDYIGVKNINLKKVFVDFCKHCHVAILFLIFEPVMPTRKEFCIIF